MQLHTQSSGFRLQGVGFRIQNLGFVEDMKCQILALAFGLNSTKRFQLFPLSSAAVEVYNCLDMSTWV